MSLSDKALLVNLHISQWVGRKLDKRATTTVETEHSTDKRVGNYTKKLLPGADELDQIQRLASSIRQYFYEQTLPWYSDGSRILKASNYMQFCADFRMKRDQFDAAVRDFLQAYPTLREKAKARLGDLFSEGDYPTAGYFSKAFSCEVYFLPIPDVKDFRVEVSEQEKATFQQRMQETEQQAMRDCWTRLYSVVTKATAKLQDPNGVFRDSMLDNMRELCGLLSRLNVTDDANLEASRAEVEKLLNGTTAEAVRYSATEREAVATKLRDIESKMSVFMGA